MPRKRIMFHNKRNHLVCYKSRRNGQITALFLTYLAYMGLHVTRKAFSNIKTNLAYPACRVDLGYKVFGHDDSLCCMGDLVIHENSSITKEQQKDAQCIGGISKICSLKLAVVKTVNDSSHSKHVKNVCKQSSKTQIQQCDAWFGPVDVTTKYLGVLDTLFFSMYAVGLYLSGYIVDRLDVRKTLAIGMALSASTTALFGLFGYWGIHSFWLYAVVWAINGLIQSIGWPSSVAVMGLWFGDLKLCKNVVLKRGAIIGAWASNASAGNIAGALLVTYILGSVKATGFYINGSNGDWRMCMVGAGLFLLIVAGLEWALLRLPREVSFQSAMEIDKQLLANESLQNAPNGMDRIFHDEDDQLIPLNSDMGSSDDDENDGINEHGESSIGFIEALRIPGVIRYSISYLCLKMANYAMFFWLPFYLSHTIYNGKMDSSGKANDLSTLYDIGQIIGGIAGGYVSDRLNARSPVIVFMLIPSIGIFFLFNNSTLMMLTILIPAAGFLLGGPANILSGAVAADLGTHQSLAGNSRALGTVSGIIDGTGSVGAAIGQYVIILLANCGGSCAAYGTKDQCCTSQHERVCSWNEGKCNPLTNTCTWFWVFALLMGCSFFACVMLIPLVYNDLCRGRKNKNESASGGKAYGTNFGGK
jgi:MFS transporter, OPA family, solute carrier family 37 (glycerol-3-phosphate transporter), member 3